MYQKWQKVIFQSLINEMLSKIKSPSLDWFQFTLIIKEGNIKFKGLSQQLKFRKTFQQKLTIDKEVLKNTIFLCETMVSNNKKIYIIKMKQPPQSLIHKPQKCFAWWKEFMKKKYGPDLKWFDAIAFKKDTFKIKSFDFKQNLTKILNSTQHRKCAQKICSFFQKNQKNQIQFSVFMSSIKVSSKTFYQKSFSNRSQSQISEKNNQSVTKFSQKQFYQKTRRGFTQTSQAFYGDQQINHYAEQQNFERRHNNHMKNRFFKRSNAKNQQTYFSVPIKETAQRQKSRQLYQNWIDNVQL